MARRTGRGYTDQQTKRVYKWEREVLDFHDDIKITYESKQSTSRKFVVIDVPMNPESYDPNTYTGPRTLPRYALPEYAKRLVAEGKASNLRPFTKRRLVPKYEGSLATREAIEAFIRKVWYESGLNFPPRVVFAGKSFSRAYTGLNEIHLAPWGRCKAVILHELAHCIRAKRSGDFSVAGHDVEFVRIFVDLICRYVPAWYTRNDELTASALNAGILS